MFVLNDHELIRISCLQPKTNPKRDLVDDENGVETDRPAGKKVRIQPALKPASVRAPQQTQPIQESMPEREELLKLVEEDDAGDSLDEASLKRMILNFEKRVLKNQELRIKFPDSPEK